MMYDFSTLLEHFHYLELATILWQLMEIDYQTIYDYIPPLWEVSSRKCKRQASNAEQNEEVGHQGWCFTLHS